MKVALISLPWSEVSRPSGAIGALFAFMEDKAPEIDVSTHYEYIEVAERIGMENYQIFSEASNLFGELFYGSVLYPEMRKSALQTIASRALGIQKGDRKELQSRMDTFQSIKMIASTVWVHLDEHLDEFARKVATYDLVGMTTVFGQLFGNVSLAQRIKKINPDCFILLGGSTTSAEVGPSILHEYQFIDAIIQGEGEGPLLHLCQELKRCRDAGDELSITPTKGLLLQNNGKAKQVPAELLEQSDMNELPIPNFDHYAELANSKSIYWHLPVEGSRGCWWDRATKTGNPKKTCYFCNLNVQWSKYREKTEETIAKEVEFQLAKYQSRDLFFLDNVIRLKGVEKLAKALQGSKYNFNFFYEVRANLQPIEVLELYKAGLNRVQYGIEGLNTDYLRRIGKGTTLLQNLLAIKLCKEFDITLAGNLIIDFPGTTIKEIEDTAATIVRYGCNFPHLMISPFWLGRGSTVDRVLDEYPISNIRNADFYRSAIPDEVFDRLQLFDLSYDTNGERPNWQPVIDAHTKAAAIYYKCKGFPKTYIEERDSVVLEILNPTDSTIELNGWQRDLFFYVGEIRTEKKILEFFSSQATTEEIKKLLEFLVVHDLVIHEKNRYLSVVPAKTPELAEKRIRRVHSWDTDTAQSVLVKEPKPRFIAS